jgi:hypothetical protein
MHPSDAAFLTPMSKPLIRRANAAAHRLIMEQSAGWRRLGLARRSRTPPGGQAPPPGAGQGRRRPPTALVDLKIPEAPRRAP